MVVALGLGSRADALCLYRRAQVDAQHPLDDTGLSPYHETDIKTEHTVLRYIFQAQCVFGVGDAVCGGGLKTPKTQISTSRMSRVLYVFAVSADKMVLSARAAKT